MVMFTEAVLFTMCLGHVMLPHNKVIIGLQIDPLLFEIHCDLLYHHSSDISSGNTSGQVIAPLESETLLKKSNVPENDID